MKQIKEWLLDVFVHAGVTKEEYTKINSEINEKNRKTLTIMSGIAGAILLFLFVLSFFSSTITHNTLLYGATMLLLLTLWLTARTVLSRYPQRTLPFCYILLLLFFGFGIILGTVNLPDMPATTFCVLLLAGPLLFIEKPYRMSIVLLSVVILFCYASFHTKPVNIANLDEINALSFFFVGVAVNAMITRVKMRELLHQHYIELARDTDDLTRLMTKSAMENAIKKYIKRTNNPAALLVIDIDNFKAINDTYGHAYGDAVLRIMGQCIQQAFGSSDLKGRFGGDEFIVFMPDVSEAKPVSRQVEVLVDLMKSQITLPEKARYIQGSIGIAFYPENAEDYQKLFLKADQALYISKKNGKNRYTFYIEGNAIENEVESQNG